MGRGSSGHMMEEDTIISSNDVIPFPKRGWGMRSPIHRKGMNDDQRSTDILLMKEKQTYKKGGNRKIHQSQRISERVISEINTIRGIRSFCLYAMSRLYAGMFSFQII